MIVCLFVFAFLSLFWWFVICLWCLMILLCLPCCLGLLLCLDCVFSSSGSFGVLLFVSFGLRLFRLLHVDVCDYTVCCLWICALRFQLVCCIWFTASDYFSVWVWRKTWFVGLFGLWFGYVCVLGLLFNWFVLIVVWTCCCLLQECCCVLCVFKWN